MILYTCGQKKRGPAFAHPCSKAGRALDAAGYDYEMKVVGSYRLMPWTWGSRAEERAAGSPSGRSDGFVVIDVEELVRLRVADELVVVAPFACFVGHRSQSAAPRFDR